MKVAVIGASGYVGAELVALLSRHDKLSLEYLVVSEDSTSAGKSFSLLHPRYQGICDLPLIAFSSVWLKQVKSNIDAVFFATPHEYSAQWASRFLQYGIKVFDLSGGFRLNQLEDYPKYYGFEHPENELLEQAVYGLAEWQAEHIASADLIAVPGCYPTASLLALKPITTNHLHLNEGLIVVNGISGVSGAGRKMSMATSFNEVSLTPYNILQHRHQPEISQEANTPVIFNPHLAPFKRGLMSTVTLTVKGGVTKADVDSAFSNAYQNSPLVRISADWPKIDNVAYSPFADIHWQLDESSQVLVVCCAIDNLLKGAASQAIQCANISMNLDSHYALMPATSLEQVNG